MSQLERKIIVQNRLRGVVIDGELVQRRRAAVHMLHRPALAWAVGDDVLAIARTLGAVRVRIVDTETGAEYVTDMTTFDAHGRRLDFGYGAQTALSLRHWQKQSNAAQQTDAAPTTPAGAVQGALFA